MLFRSYGITLVLLSVVAGLASFIVAALISLVVRRLRRGDPPSMAPDASESDRRSWTAVLRSRYVLLALPLGFALGLYLILDLAVSVSVYPGFTASYVAFWALVLLLLPRGSPVRYKLLIPALLTVAVFSIRLIDWSSRKPFLKDLYRINKGMTAARVEQIMGDYMTGGGVPLGSPRTRLDERGELVTGTISYRHTNEWWGNSDWGVVAFEDSRVVATWFS